MPERQLAVLERDTSLAMVTCRQDMIDEYGEVIARDCGLRQRDLVGTQRRTAIVRRLVRHGGTGRQLQHVLFRRSAFDAAAAFPDDNFFALDVLTWVRLLEHGDFYGMPETLTSFRINSGSHTTELGGEAIRIQRSFVEQLRRDNADTVRRSDTLFGALRAPLTRLRHHMIFAAGGPVQSRYRQLATRALGVRRSPPPVQGGRRPGRGGGRPVAVLEIDPRGHHLHYLNHLVTALGADRCAILTTDRTRRSAEYGLLADSVCAPTLLLPESPSRREVLAAAVNATVDAGARRLVVPDGDHYLVALRFYFCGTRNTAADPAAAAAHDDVGGPERLRPATVVKPILVQALRLFPRSGCSS